MSLIWKTYILCGVLALINSNALVTGEDDEDIGVPPKDIVITPRGAGVTKILGDKQYYIETYDKLDWYQASVACTQKGMTLASIESEKEYRRLGSHLIIQGLKDKKFWLSGSNLVNNEYKWMDSGKSIVYEKWSAEAREGQNKCIQTDADFKWGVKDCTTDDDKAYFICSKPLLPNCGPGGACRFTYQRF
ncbi:C-type lectin 37Db [Haematobia irritans]|uniref:C-type lectin 37Db n=1 Tax=Haematobia irritans TaxID=7368 RepID=UPI003F504268